MTAGQWLLQLTTLDYGLLGILLILSLVAVNRLLKAIVRDQQNRNPYSGLEIPGPAVQFLLAALLTALGYLFLSPWMHSLLAD